MVANTSPLNNDPPARLLPGRSAIVTGGAQGIGEAICLELARHGANVVVADIHEAQARDTAARIAAETGQTLLPFAVNVSDKPSVERMVQTAVERFGKLDILVNNAGILKPHLIVDFPEDDWDRIFAVNVKGTFLCSQAAARQMIRQGSGRIVNISSASGKKPDREESAYCASKSAIIGFTRCLALELGPHGITANCICPGATDTKMLRDLFAAVPGVERELLAKTPLGRIATPRDQANAVVFLVSHLASHVTGESLIVSGGELMEQ